MNVDKIKDLETKISQAQTAYYNGSEIMTDDEYDALCYELGTLDPNNVLLVKVGAEPVGEWKKEKHLYPLGSLNKVNTPQEMTKWITENLENRKVVVTEKLDGLSIGLEYENGKLTKANLRGSGSIGENILVNVLKMQGVVKSIPDFNGVVRGEIILTKTNHQKYFSEYKNPRNSASGLCRALDGKGCQHLQLMCYQVMSEEPFATEEEQLTFLKKHGFLFPNYKVCEKPEEVNQWWKEYQDGVREALDWEIDGLVISCDDVAFATSLGVTNMRPKGKMAFKFANQFVSTTVKNIEWTVGTMGRITPVCWVDPINLLGSTVEKASVYNLSYIEELGLDVGAEVLICKAGEIIPRVEKVVKSTGSIARPPINCPVCNSILEMNGEYIECHNLNCLAQLHGRITNWVKELNILEVGDGLIEKLVDSELVATPADLYTLTIEQIANLDRMGKKSATNVYKSIWSVNPITLDVFLGALSIPLVGSSTIRLLMENGYDTLPNIQAMSLEQMENIKGMGPARSQSLYDGLKNNKKLIDSLLKNGVKIKEKVMGKLEGKSFVFTGAMVNKRAVLEKMVTDAGGTVKGSVSKGVNFLVIADAANSTSSKAVRARELGTVLLSEDEFLAMLQ